MFMQVEQSSAHMKLAYYNFILSHDANHLFLELNVRNFCFILVSILKVKMVHEVNFNK